ncbi:MAG: hypothetical protein WC655_23420 [Candidatus Hydrogenedentales bacterium]
MATISCDTDISEETVVKRLRWLESIGAIALFKCWCDENGRRNHEGRGKPTSSEIRFLFDADVDAIEAAAREAIEPKALRGAALAAHQVNIASTRHGRELDDDGQPPASPLPAPCQPPPGTVSHIEGNLEPEEEIPPNPPSGGGSASVDQELEADITEFARTYPSPITNLPRLRNVLTAMTSVERRKVLTAVKGYADHIAECERRKKPRTVKDADRWVAAGMWQGYVLSGEKAEIEGQRVRVPIESEDARAWANLCRVGKAPEPLGMGGFYNLRRALTAQERAFAELPLASEWKFLVTNEELAAVTAWSEFIAGALSGVNRSVMACERGIGSERKRGILVPWKWPPRKDGKLYTHGPPTAPEMSEEDIREFSKNT